jgi:hypothetical protein
MTIVLKTTNEYYNYYNFFNLTNKLHILNMFKWTPCICLNFYLKVKSKKYPFEDEGERFHNINFQ